MKVVTCDIKHGNCIGSMSRTIVSLYEATCLCEMCLALERISIVISEEQPLTELEILKNLKTRSCAICGGV